MNKYCKVQIYKGMLQYLLDSTNYTLKNIADLCDTRVTNIRSIYCDEIFPVSFSSELKLLKLYEAIVRLEPYSYSQTQFKNYPSRKSYQNGV